MKKEKVSSLFMGGETEEQGVLAVNTGFAGR